MIGRNTDLLAATSVVYTGPVVVSEGPAAAFLTGVGVVGSTGGDADRHFDLAVVTDAPARMIGVGVQYTPTLAGGPDGRLYVVDGQLSAYALTGGAATRVSGPVATTTGCPMIEIDAKSVSCGDARLPLGTQTAAVSWTVTHLDTTQLSSLDLNGVTGDCGGVPGCERFDLSTGARLWAVPIAWHDAGSDFRRTALVSRIGSVTRTALIDAIVAAIDPSGKVLYGWGNGSDLNKLLTFDITTLLGS